MPNVMQLLNDNMMAVIIFAAVLLTAAAVAVYVRIRRGRPLPMDKMEGHDFEHYCAELLRGQGFCGVEVTPGSRDFGADILATRDGVSYAFQCKRYDGPVGVQAVQEIYAGRDYYDAMVGVVMTNQSFTSPAEELANKLKVLLWDRDVLVAMEAMKAKKAK